MTKKLTIDWWIRQRNVYLIRQALSFGFADHCYQLVQQGLQANASRQRWPTSWASYAHAAALPSEGNLKRKRFGQTMTLAHECLGIASLIDTPPAALPPPQTVAWLASAISYLGPELRPADCQLFADYSLRQFARHQAEQYKLTKKKRVLGAEFVIHEPELASAAQALGLELPQAQQSILLVKKHLESCL